MSSKLTDLTALALVDVAANDLLYAVDVSASASRKITIATLFGDGTNRTLFTDASGRVIVRQPGGVAGMDEVQISHNGTLGTIESKDGSLLLKEGALGGLAVLSSGAGGTGVLTVYGDNTTTYPRAQLNGGGGGIEGINLAANCQFRFSNNANNLTTFDTGLSRSTAGQSQFTDGSTGLGGLIVRGDITMPFVVRQNGGTPGTDEARIYHDGTQGVVHSMDGGLFLSGSSGSPVNYSLNCRSVGDYIFQWAGVGSIYIGQVVIGFIPTFVLGWCAGSSGSVTDIAFARDAAGVVKVTDGSSGGGWLQNAAGRAVLGSPVTNVTTTLANLTDLTRTLKAGRKYTGRLVLPINNAKAVDGFKLDLNGGTATMTSVEFGFTSAIGATLGTRTSTALNTAITLTALTDTADVFVEVAFTCVVNAAGTIIPRQAKNSDAAGATLTTRTGGYIWLEDTP